MAFYCDALTTPLASEPRRLHLQFVAYAVVKRLEPRAAVWPAPRPMPRSARPPAARPAAPKVTLQLKNQAFRICISPCACSRLQSPESCHGKQWSCTFNYCCLCYCFSYTCPHGPHGPAMLLPSDLSCMAVPKVRTNQSMCLPLMCLCSLLMFTMQRTKLHSSQQ